MLLVGDERFETYSEAAKFLRVSSGVLRQRFSEFEISKRHEDQFPLFVDGISFRTFQDARNAFQMSAEELDAIIMGSKEFNFQDENHKITIPKSIAICWGINIV